MCFMRPRNCTARWRHSLGRRGSLLACHLYDVAEACRNISLSLLGASSAQSQVNHLRGITRPASCSFTDRI
jgi:hypothetical protein